MQESDSIQEIQEAPTAGGSSSNSPAAAAGPSTSNIPTFRTMDPADEDNSLRDLKVAFMVESVYHYAEEQRARAAVLLIMTFNEENGETFSYAAIPMRATGTGISDLQDHPLRDERISN
ncbi:hypothetical protein K503DRAFT_870956, partial [Rhizopogon vinicolor AM-OR11-026]